MGCLAIIMATYNGEKYIEKQLDSILNNKYRDYVIHVCDDGSTDNTYQIIQTYRERYPNKILVHRNEKTLGVRGNFLYWTKMIDADYYMYSDQDDIWKPNKIGETLAFLQENEKKYNNVPIAVFSNAELIDGRGNHFPLSFFEREKLDTSKLSFTDLLMENKLLGCTVMFNKQVQAYISTINSYSGVRMHDWWIGLVASAFGKVLYIDQKLIEYRQHENNQVGINGIGGYVLKNLFSWSKQRELLYKIFEQAKFFLDTYRQDLNEEQIEYLEEMTTFYKLSWVERKYRFIKNGYRKTGWLRNLGMWLVV